MSAWSVVWDVGRTTSTVLVDIGTPGLVLWWLRDRRRDRAAVAVAEQTIGADVTLKDTGALEARLVYVQRSFDLERSFHVHQVADRDAEIVRQRTELAHRDQVIEELQEQVGRLQAKLADATRQPPTVRDRLGELAHHSGAPRPRPRPRRSLP